MPTTGHCNCSGITVTLEQMPQKSAVCYCANCRRSGSGLCSVVYFLDRSAVQLDDPKSYLRTYQDSNTNSGKTVHRAFCSNCGSPVYSAMGPDTPMLIVKGGLFDEAPEPAQEFFAEKRPGWVNVTKAAL